MARLWGGEFGVIVHGRRGGLMYSRVYRDPCKYAIITSSNCQLGLKGKLKKEENNYYLNRQTRPILEDAIPKQ